MSRRWAGGLVLLLVLLAAVTVPHLTASKIAGVAEIAAAVPGPPAVGDCLLAPVGPADPALNGQLIYPPESIGPCTGARYGEVAGIIPASKIQPGTRSAVDGSVDDPNMRTCHLDTTLYLGNAPSDDRFPLGGGWNPAPVIQTLGAGPTPAQRAMGQHWIACIEYLGGHADTRPRAGDYRRTAKSSYSTGSPPAAFATCLASAADAAVGSTTVDCHAPHAAELFGWASGTATTSSLALSNTCNTLVSQYTRIPDATAAGKLAVNIHVFDSTGSPLPNVGTDVSMYSATCVVTPTGGRQLTGPLMGLGRAPLPLN